MFALLQYFCGGLFKFNPLDGVVTHHIDSKNKPFSSQLWFSQLKRIVIIDRAYHDKWWRRFFRRDN